MLRNVHHEPFRPGIDAAEYHALVEAAVDGIVVIDESGRILEFNPAAERLFGCPADQAIGQPVEILMPEPHCLRHAEYLERYLVSGEARIIGAAREVEGRRADGHTFPMTLSVGEAIAPDGRRRFIGIVRDLTSQRRAELAARDLGDRLTDVARYSLMSEMCSEIAHEINQPLSAIATYAQAGKRLAGANSPSRERLAEICDKIAAQAARAGSVIKNLREFVGRRETRAELLDLNDVVESGIGLIERNTRAEGVDLVVRCSAEPLPVEGDLAQLHQVLYNLARNAIDALRLVEHEKWLEIKTEAVSEDLVQFSVSDCGPGVPPDLVEGIFHPFVTTKEYGLGVGLAMSRSIVESHAGRLGYAPNPAGGGAVFTVYLPRVPAK